MSAPDPPPVRPINVEDLDAVTALAAPSMEALRDARVLVTGASGFFGSWVVESFHHMNKALGLGASLVGVSAPSDDLSQRCPHLLGLDDVRMIRADTRTLGPALREQVPEWHDRIDAIIHAAIHVDSRTYDRAPLPTMETAIIGTWEVLELAARARAQRLLFISSGAVYGAQPSATTRIDEDHPAHLDPAAHGSAYAESKRVGETLCAGYIRQHGVPATIARPFAFVGPHLPLDRQFAIGNFIRDALRGGPIVILSDGSPVRSYLYASDLAVWLWTILSRGTHGRPYNVGSEHAVSLLDLAHAVARAVGPEIAVEVRGRTDPSRPPQRYVPSTRRSQGELGLRETVTLDDAIRRTVAWHRGGR